ADRPYACVPSAGRRANRESRRATSGPFAESQRPWTASFPARDERCDDLREHAVVRVAARSAALRGIARSGSKTRRGVAGNGGPPLPFVGQVRSSTARRARVPRGRAAALSLLLARFAASTFFGHVTGELQIVGRRLRQRAAVNDGRRQPARCVFFKI